MLGGSVSMLQEVYQHFQSIFRICFTAQMTSFQEQIMQLGGGTEGSKHVFACNPVFWKFLEVLLKEETVVRVGILQNEGGHHPPPQRRNMLIANNVSSKFSMTYQIVEELII